MGPWSLVRGPISVSCSSRETSPAWRLSSFSTSERAAGCFWRSTSRVTTSTSVSESWTRIRKRSSILAGERRLTGPDEHHLAVELFGENFGDLGDRDRPVDRRADVLLHFVQDED